MAVISDHQTLMNHVLSDPGNPEGEIWVVRDAWEAGCLIRAPSTSILSSCRHFCDDSMDDSQCEVA